MIVRYAGTEESAGGPMGSSGAVVSNCPKTTASRPQLSRTQMNLVFVTVLLGMLLSALDQTIVSTALPTIVGDLGGAGHMSWIVTAYLLAETVSTVLAGKFGDVFGRKRVFQGSVAVFIIGSFFCGLANSMSVLIVMRAVQGIGGGDLAVTSTALIGEVIPIRDRGRYQGALGAVFGVTTVVGPLLGGVFTDQLSWRWAFYVNVPVAVIVIAMAARTIPSAAERTRVRIDYLGVLFVALGATGLTLATSWGGTQYAWGSVFILGLFAGSVVALGIFVLVELHAAEPILPMRLFRSRVFASATVLSFIVGFAMMGSITFLPTFLQYAGGASATVSGLRTLPMVVGLLITAVLSGTVVGRTGVYKPFPIAGAAVMAVGLYLLSRMTEHTSVLLESVYMLILGAGIGLIMQILTLVVQNTADYRDLGAATSGVTFFRTLGGSFGASILGSIYSNHLTRKLSAVVAQAGGINPSAASNPIVHVYAQSLHYVFLWAAPIAVVAFALSLLMPQVAMRGTSRDAATDTGDGFAMPASPDSADQLETLVARVMRKYAGSASEDVLARSGSPLDRAAAWGVLQVYLYGALIGDTARQATVEGRLGIPSGVLASFFDEIVDRGYLRRDGDALTLTDSGTQQVAVLTGAWRDWLVEQLHDWLPSDTGQAARVQAALKRIVTRLVLEEKHQPVPA